MRKSRTFEYLVRYVLFLKWRMGVKINTLGKGTKVDGDDIYWVNPNEIKYTSRKEFDIYKDRGKVVGGNWDALDKKFDELDVYEAFKKVLIEKKNWENTKFYHRVLGEINNGEKKWGCATKSEFSNRLKDIESLYENIKKEGYKLKKELIPIHPDEEEDEITVNIGRYGDLLFNNGRHRLSIAKLLNINKIPVKITVRHQKWIDFKKEILNYTERHQGRLYQSLTHIDLQDMPSQYGDDRFNLIWENTNIKKGKLLDIGAHWGYFCHKFEEKGFDCYAVESSKEHLYFMKRLKRAENRNFKIIPQSMFDFYNKTNEKFDIVLALNIFHHFIKDKDNYYRLINFLNKLKTEEIFFQPHFSGEPQMRGAFKNFNPEGFVAFILKNSYLNKKQFIGKSEDGRLLYRLHK